MCTQSKAVTETCHEALIEANLKKIPLFLKYLYFMHKVHRNILVTVVEITVQEYRNIH